MKIFFALLFLLGAFHASRAEEPAPVPNRFLFVVEKSFVMNRSAKAAHETVSQLIESGVQGQMRPGDTFGLWTFNESLDTAFPMQEWNAQSKKKLATDALAYLRKDRYEKKGQLETVLPPLYSVIKSSHAITVVLISSGREPIRGTSFDQKINEVYKLYETELLDAKLPFVTALVGRLGRPVAYSVNSSLRIQIPDLRLPSPSELSGTKTNVVAKTNEPPQVIKPAAPKQRIAKENIIISGPIVKIQPTTNTTTTNVAAAVAKESPEITKTNPVPASPSPKQTAKVEMPVTQETIHPETNVKTQSDNSALPSSQPVISKPSTNIVSSSIAFDDPSTFKPQPQNVESSPDLPAEKSRTAPNKMIEHNRVSEEPAAALTNESAQSSPVPSVVATKTFNAPKKLVLIAVFLLCLAVLLVFLLIRNSRNKSGPSLISRSIDQSGK